MKARSKTMPTIAQIISIPQRAALTARATEKLGAIWPKVHILSAPPLLHPRRCVNLTFRGQHLAHLHPMVLGWRGFAKSAAIIVSYAQVGPIFVVSTCYDIQP